MSKSRSRAGSRSDSRAGSDSRSRVTSDDVRRIALALPETAEKIAWGMPTFRVAGKMFVTVPDDETSFAVRCPKVEREELVLAEPDKFWVAAHEAGSAWVRVRLEALDTEELTDILADSWRQASPPGLLEAHPELGVVPTQ
ncbi:MmcQ/YjbR family DNA-binding protein [Streptomyces sp. NPDC058284]|uniref:MmcQ/YjbR family DNA-binding protein n=1 Tax=unclassified Streptomyces TaxID=2593676 RepID=UPI0036693E99